MDELQRSHRRVILSLLGLLNISFFDIMLAAAETISSGEVRENALPSLSTTAEVPGSWAYEKRGQPNEEARRRSGSNALLLYLPYLYLLQRHEEG